MFCFEYIYIYIYIYMVSTRFHPSKIKNTSWTFIGRNHIFGTIEWGCLLSTGEMRTATRSTHPGSLTVCGVEFSALWSTWLITCCTCHCNFGTKYSQVPVTKPRTPWYSMPKYLRLNFGRSLTPTYQHEYEHNRIWMHWIRPYMG